MKNSNNNNNTTFVSYHGDPAIKAKYVERVRQHQIADGLVQGFGYWRDGKGCAVGCTLELPEGQHDRYEIELGLPEWLARLEDHLFETLPVDEATAFPLELLEAVEVGISKRQLEVVRDQFQIFWLERQITQVAHDEFPGIVTAIQNTITLLRQAVSGEEPEAAAWSAARSAAWSAARSAAESAVRSAARSAARSAVRSAAESAAWSAAWSAVRSAAESAA